ncbi:uncharacterized protein LOC9652205 [Selaginella moellendorffii]|nr:uncharacterized protein LOC9652205 [Selaginella moellendorffii]|eukprot:XP_002966114.2 uncharacterized protein LOC9652205 [Selaginella moellendorffii]
MSAASTAVKLGMLATPSKISESRCHRSTRRAEAHASSSGTGTGILEMGSCRCAMQRSDGELIHKMTKSTMEAAIGPAGVEQQHRNISVATRLAEGVLEEKPCLDENAQQWWIESGGRLPSLERILLEARWSFRQEVEWSSSREGDSEMEESSNPKVVRSGRPGARQRRLAAKEQRGETTTSTSSREEGLGNNSSKNASVPTRRRRTKGVKTERSMKGFVDSFLKNAEPHDMTNEEQLDLWEKIRMAGELVKEQERLISKLGYEPSMHQLATASGLPVKQVTLILSQGGAARKRMILSNLRLVVAIARRYENMGVEIGDLIQEGTLGLIHGLEKFDVSRGFKFSTYAYWWIFQAMIRSLDKRGKCVRYPFHLCEAIRKINQLRNRQVDDRPVSVETMMQVLKLPRARIEIALQASNYRLTSLDRHVANKRCFEEGDPLEDFIVDQNVENQPWLMAERDAVKEELDRLLESKLDAREREVIRKRFGLHPNQTSPLSRHEIGRSCGISRERVRQLENDAMAKLRACKSRLSMEFLLSSAYDTILW